MTQQLKDYCEQEGMSADDIINEEIVEERKKNNAYLKDVKDLIEKIHSSQQEKNKYFAEVLAGKHKGKKLIQQKFVLEFAEVIDYDKNQLVYEETSADKEKNNEYLKQCSTSIEKAALLFANEIQKHDKFSIEFFGLFFRDYEKDKSPSVEIDKTTKIPPEVLKAARNAIDSIIGGEKGTEKEAETV